MNKIGSHADNCYGSKPGSMGFTMTKFRKFYLPLFTALIAASIASSSTGSDIRSRICQATHGFKDITLTAKVIYANQNELKKIGKDFPKSYEFKSTTVRFKAPDKMKMEGKLGMVKASIVINGDRKATVIPSVHYSKKENIAGEPHKRQTDLDIGIVTGSLWQDYIVLDSDTEGSTYKITFARENSRDNKHICWIDSKTLKLLKVEKYDSGGNLKSRYIYSKHSLIDGLVWVPGRADVYNCEGKLAGSTGYENIKVNTGIPDSVFKI